MFGHRRRAGPLGAARRASVGRRRIVGSMGEPRASEEGLGLRFRGCSPEKGKRRYRVHACLDKRRCASLGCSNALAAFRLSTEQRRVLRHRNPREIDAREALPRPVASSMLLAAWSTWITMSERAAITDDVRRALAAEEGGRRWLRRAAALGVVAVLVGGGLVFRAKNRPPPPARYVTTTPSTGDVAEKVQATGAVQPVLQVNVGSQVNGRVAKVHVDFNSRREEGRPPRRDRSHPVRRAGHAGLRAGRRAEGEPRERRRPTPPPRRSPSSARSVSSSRTSRARASSTPRAGPVRGGEGAGLGGRGADRRDPGAARAVADQRRLDEDLLARRRRRRLAQRSIPARRSSRASRRPSSS